MRPCLGADLLLTLEAIQRIRDTDERKTRAPHQMFTIGVKETERSDQIDVFFIKKFDVTSESGRALAKFGKFVFVVTMIVTMIPTVVAAILVNEVVRLSPQAVPLRAPHFFLPRQTRRLDVGVDQAVLPGPVFQDAVPAPLGPAADPGQAGAINILVAGRR
jgi:hypothetical protein